MHLRRAVLQRLSHVHDRRQLRDVELDRLGRVARLLEALGHHRRHDLAHMPHLAGGQDRMPGLGHGLSMLVRHLPAAGQTAHPLEIGAGEDLHHPRHRRRGGRVERRDRSVCHVRAQEMHVGLAVDVDVVGVVPGPRQEPHVLAPLRRGPYPMILGHVFKPP